MKDKLVELLEKKYDHYCDQCGVNKDTHYIENMADYLLSHGVIFADDKKRFFGKKYMKHRVIEIILTEGIEPITEECLPGGPAVSEVGYRITYNGQEYGSYVEIGGPQLCEEQILEAAEAMLLLALEAYRELEKERP